MRHATVGGYWYVQPVGALEPVEGPDVRTGAGCPTEELCNTLFGSGLVRNSAPSCLCTCHGLPPRLHRRCFGACQSRRLLLPARRDQLLTGRIIRRTPRAPCRRRRVCGMFQPVGALEPVEGPGCSRRSPFPWRTGAGCPPERTGSAAGAAGSPRPRRCPLSGSSKTIWCSYVILLRPAHVCLPPIFTGGALVCVGLLLPARRDHLLTGRIIRRTPRAPCRRRRVSVCLAGWRTRTG